MDLSDDEIDALAAGTGTSGGDLSDAEMEALAGPIVKSKMGLGEATLRGAAQGASFGFADEMASAAGAAKDVLTGNVPSGKPIDEPGFQGYLKSLADKYGNAYASYIGKIRAKDAEAQTEHPWGFYGGLAGGGVASAFTPIGAATAPVKGASIGANAARLAAGGALMGAGTTAAPPSSPDFYKAAASGAGLNVGMGGALAGRPLIGAAGGGIAGYASSDPNANTGEKVGRAVIGAGLGTLAGGAGAIAGEPKESIKKLANVFLNTPEYLTEKYIQNPGIIDNPNILKRHELASKLEENLSALKGEVESGSAASRKILDEEGRSIKGADIASVFKNVADGIESRAEGVMGDDPQKLAAYNWLRSQEGLFQTAADRDLSTNRVKDLLQALDRQTDFEIGSGKFARIDDTVKKGVRSEIDKLLKGQSPAYEQQMVGVANDTNLLKDASDLATSPAGVTNLFRRLHTDQYGSGQLPLETLQNLDTRMNTDLLKQAELSYLKESLDKSATNGSRAVQMYKGMLSKIPLIGEPLAALTGGSVDKYGRRLTMGAVDFAAKLNRTFQTQGFQAFLRDAQPIIDASRRADPAALLTMQLLERSNPELARKLRGGGNGAE